MLDQNAEDLTAIKFWSGTLEEYEALGEWDDNTLYNITDDMTQSESGGGTGGLTELPIASTDTLGGVKVDGDTINVTQDGVISANIIKSYNDLTDKPTIITSYNDLTDKPTIPSAYTLPIASTTTLGGVKVDGETITIENGIISASSSGGGGGGVASVIEVYGNSSSGYRLWSDGYCEQWGVTNTPKTDAPKVMGTITFLKPFKDSNYHMTGSPYSSTLSSSVITIHSAEFGARTTSSVSFTVFPEGSYSIPINDTSVYWRASGYVS